MLIKTIRISGYKSYKNPIEINNLNNGLNIIGINNLILIL